MNGTTLEEDAVVGYESLATHGRNDTFFYSRNEPDRNGYDPYGQYRRSPYENSTGSRCSSRRRRPCVIKFDTSINETHEVETLDELPVDSIWYTKEEYSVIKQYNAFIVRQVRSGQFIENEEHTSRSLEHKLKEVHRKRRDAKFAALNAILEEQERQMRRGKYDPETIAAAYADVSRPCHEDAHTRGVLDARQSINHGLFKMEYTTFADDDSKAQGDDTSVCSSSTSGTNQSERKKKKNRVRGFVKKMRRRASM